MTPVEHYREAERHLELAAKTPFHHDDTNPTALVYLAQAQVHAQLAQVGMTVGAIYSMKDLDEWEMALKGQVPS